MRLLLAGGGTGGHLFPAVALAEQLLAEESEAEVLFVGTKRGIEARILPELGLPLATVDIKGFSGKGLMAKLEVIFMLAKSVKNGISILKSFTPDVVIGVGGYASAPMVIAAKLRGVPVVLHEQNAIPGLTNRLLARWAARICVSFAETVDAFPHSKTELTGNPLRGSLENCPESESDQPMLLVFGGSRGARAINAAMVEALASLTEWNNRLEIVHQTGEEDVEMVRQKYTDAGWSKVTVTPFINDMAEVYRRAHLVVCRAGATTVAELTACGRPALLIPYPHAAADHQSANARALASKGAALMLDQKEVTGTRLAAIISGLLQEPEELASMARIAGSLGRKGAAGRIIEICRQLMESQESTTREKAA